MSETLSIEDPSAHARAVEELRAGRLVVAPTDTIYAVLADAFTPAATRRLLRVRASGRNRPAPVLISRPRQLSALSLEISEAVDRLVAAYWPGPLTLIVRSVPGMTWDLGNSAGTVALRMPDDDWLLELGRESGPLAGTGAFRRRREVPTTVEEAREQLGEAVALYIDGGPREGPRSTIVDASLGEDVEVAREGAIPSAHIAMVAGGELGWGRRPGPDTGERDPAAGDEEPVTADTPERPGDEPDPDASVAPGDEPDPGASVAPTDEPGASEQAHEGRSAEAPGSAESIEERH